MGYACPVCADPQADAGHLANHLAFTAIARGGDHEVWLDEHVPDWSEMDEDGLAAAVVGLAEEREYPQLFEDTTDGDAEGLDPDDVGHDHAGHDHGTPGSPDHPAAIDPAGIDGAAGNLDPEAREILERAMELTEERQDGDSETE